MEIVSATPVTATWGDAREWLEFDPFDLTARVAIVTGGGTGIGRAIALVLARLGATVVLASRTVENLDRVAEEVREVGGTARTIPVDVRDPAECRALIEGVAAEHGHLDILVNNAGRTTKRTFDAWDLADWEQVINLNLRSVWLLSLAAAPIMAAAGKGAIVNISSAASIRPVPPHALYGVAKAGMNNLTLTFAAQFGPQGVRTNGIAVGPVKSDFFLGNAAAAGIDPDVYGGVNALGRAGWPIEIGWPVAFLVSDASSFMNGETISIGGGMAGPVS